MQVYIAVGSVYGHAQDVAERLQAILQGQAFNVLLDDEPSLAGLKASQASLLLVCTSTSGDGDFPPNIALFYRELATAEPVLATCLTAVVALGDRAYGDSFAQAGCRFDALLASMPGRGHAPMLVLDACDGADPLDLASDWLADQLRCWPTPSNPAG